MSTMNNLHRVIFLKGVKDGTMTREEQLMYINELLYERGPESRIAQELKTQIQKIRFLQGLKSGTRQVEEIMPVKAETWLHKEGRYQLLGTGKWITRGEYSDLPELEGELLVRMIYYLGTNSTMDKKEKQALLDWIGGGKPLFSAPPPGFFKYMIKEGLSRDDLYIRMSDQAIVFFEEVLKAEQAAKERNEPFEACHMMEIVFPNSRGEDVM